MPNDLHSDRGASAERAEAAATTDHSDELFVDDDGSPETVWLTAKGRSAIEAARIVHDTIGLDRDGFGVSMVYGVIEPQDGTSERRFRKVGPERAHETIAMWKVELA